VTRRRILILGAAVLAVLVPLAVRPLVHLAVAVWRDPASHVESPLGHADDASRLNATRVAEIVHVAREEDAVEALRRARAQWRRVSIAGARHSQGGHTIAPDGIVLDMLAFARLEMSGDTLRAGSGALWSKIIPFLNDRGRSVAVMQSDHSFSVGGSLSVNCHGWQNDTPPIASTVESFRMLRANGSVVRCSRSENAELFAHAIGGYGLFGVILDVDLRTVPNELYRLDRTVFPAERFVEVYREKVTADTGIVYGRLCVVPDNFLREAILNVYRRVPDTAGNVYPLPSPEESVLRRAVFRGSIDSAYGKKLRWDMEKNLDPALAAATPSRNELLHHSVEAYLGHAADRTDILQEYFVPPNQLAAFVERLRDIVPRHGADLLNVTLRTVARDDDTVLRYTDSESIAVVMFFSQPRTAEADSAMEPMTREIIDAALGLGGCYYLPYRLHATVEQFARAYPQALDFFAKKRTYDPEGLFSNRFYEKYGQ
jgi:FAD/FMN-containing dehydrogenase